MSILIWKLKSPWILVETVMTVVYYVFEKWELLRIITKSSNVIPTDYIKIDDKSISPPSRVELKQSMEALIHHFKLYTQRLW